MSSALLRTGLLSLLLLCPPVLAAEQHPRVGLVLSGGGARGLTHIGILRALEENNIQIAAIAGTSMGAIVGALYASGRSPDELEMLARELDWAQTLDDDPPRRQLNFRRKQDSREYLVKTRATLKDGALSLPRGVVQGQNLQLMLQRQFLHVSHISDFDDLPIPFRAIATDLATGSAHVFAEGSLATAVQASMSIPGLYAPVEFEGKLLVDGGIANNLPVDVMKAMDVDYVIAVDIATPLYSAEKLDTVVPIIEQLTTLLTFNQIKSQYALLSEHDLLLTPDLTDISTADFHRIDEVINIGYRTTVAQQQNMARMASQAQRHRKVSTFKPPIINHVQINNSSDIADKLIRRQIKQPLGSEFDQELTQQNIESVYGYGYFEHVGYQLDHDILVISTQAKSWGTDLLGVSFELFSDNDGDDHYNLGINYRMSEVTPKGGEWFTVTQIGQDPEIRSELYLPLDYSQFSFLIPYLRYSQRRYNDVPAFDIERTISVNDFTFGAFVGIEVLRDAIIGIGSEAHHGHIETLVGIDPGTSHFRDRSDYLLLEYDSLDQLFFPHQGIYGSLKYQAIHPRSQLRDDFRVLDANITGVVPIQAHSLIFHAEWSRSIDNLSGRHFQKSLGGFLRLSGYPEDALVGDNLLFARTTWLHRFDIRQSSLLDLPFYLGFSLETGNVWQSSANISFKDTLSAASVLAGLDTPVGPIYVGYGKSTGGTASFYLRLGRLF